MQNCVWHYRLYGVVALQRLPETKHFLSHIYPCKQRGLAFDSDANQGPGRTRGCTTWRSLQMGMTTALAQIGAKTSEWQDWR